MSSSKTLSCSFAKNGTSEKRKFYQESSHQQLIYFNDLNNYLALNLVCTIYSNMFIKILQKVHLFNI